MTTTETPEYRKLELDSSNDLIRHDARRGDRKYLEAALHAQSAGRARLRMGQMMSDAEDFAGAAEDWLSAAACFYLATELEQMREAFDRVQGLNQEGKIPLERRDIRAAIKERKEEIGALEEKQSRFQQEYHGSEHIAGQESLNWLLRQVRELPGWVYLHVAIASQAAHLGQRLLALEHSEWAEKIEPGSPPLEALRVSLALVSDKQESKQEIQKGRELVESHPEMHDLRFLIAKCMAFPRDGMLGDWAGALQLLEPLTNEPSAPAITRLRAIALAVILLHELGLQAEYRRHLTLLNQLTETNSSDAEDLVTELRQNLPQIFPQPGSNTLSVSTSEALKAAPKLDFESVRHIFERFDTLAA